MGHEHWRAQLPVSSPACCALAVAGDKTAARANHVRAWGRGPQPSMRERLKRFSATESSLVLPFHGRPLAR